LTVRGKRCIMGDMGYKHGMRNTRFYSEWRSMINRCKFHKRYIKKRISVCDSWKKFLNFKRDMYDSYLQHRQNNKTTTLERINNKEGYFPKNCCWATAEEQNRNKSDTIRIGYDGHKICLKQLSRNLGIKYVTLHARLKRYGYSLQEALSLPNINDRRARAVYKMTTGRKIIKKYRSLAEAAKSCGVDKTAIWKACQASDRTSAGYLWKYV